MRDITDINHPTTVGAFGRVPMQFVSASQLSAIDLGGHYVEVMTFEGGVTTVVVANPQFIGDVAWSPDGTTVVYLTPTPSSASMVLHQVNAGEARVLASTPGPPGVGGCESQFCTLGETWDFKLSYSPEGSKISLVENIVKPVFRVWSPDGRPITYSDSLGATMSVWSGQGLYFRDAKGVQVWRDGVVSLFLPSVAWIRPKASPGGGQIVYETRDARHLGRIFVVNTTTGAIRELKTARFNPVFLTSRFIWYQGQRSCQARDQCPPDWSVVDNGKTFIYDLQDGTETESTITNVYDVWPHAA